jgi:hypothetical protein
MLFYLSAMLERVGFGRNGKRKAPWRSQSLTSRSQCRVVVEALEDRTVPAIVSAPAILSAPSPPVQQVLTAPISLATAGQIVQAEGQGSGSASASGSGSASGSASASSFGQGFASNLQQQERTALLLQVQAFNREQFLVTSPTPATTSNPFVYTSGTTKGSTAEFAAIDEQVTALAGQATDLLAQARAIDSQLARLQVQKSASDQQVAALAGQATALLAQAIDSQAALAGQAAALLAQAQAIDSQLARLQVQMSASDQQAAALAGQAADLLAQARAIDSQLALLQVQMSASPSAAGMATTPQEATELLIIQARALVAQTVDSLSTLSRRMFHTTHEQ